MAAMREVAAALGFEAQLPRGSAHSRELNQAFRQRFWSARRLLVLDDVRAPEHLDAFLDGEHRGHLLVTTRCRAVADQLGGQVLELGPVRPEVARALLEAAIDPNRLADDEEGTSPCSPCSPSPPASWPSGPASWRARPSHGHPTSSPASRPTRTPWAGGSAAS